ncbi:hypothetical protein PC120_g1299 [Phytophthora cactorum]|nr:hypothetical protein PC120_g1299 [Phytophthora cactorum]
MKVTGRPVEVSAGETASSGKTAPEAKQGLAHLASEVSAVFATVCFRTKFYHKVSTKGIYFEEVVGYVAGHAWLNDAVVSYVSDVITASQVGVHVLSSFVVDYEKFPSPPRSTFISMKFIVLPANIKRSHWTLIVVAVHRYGVMTMHMYDSYVLHLGMPRDAHPFPANVDIEWLMSPAQPDGNSCGVMVAAMTYSFIYGGRGFTVDAVTRDVVKVMRLRLLWEILCGSRVEPIVAADKEEATQIDKQLVSAFAKGSKRIWN